MVVSMKHWFKRLFCKHDYKPFTKNSKFHHIQGERVYIICTKCGHEKGSIFYEYEGSGYK
ncbi:hypothetical protein EI981_13315 [Paenibacillus lutimineralis]|uniref:Uncharacterized protein n=1 Tax=Paenibacillus lutimineralis TaxID=2707005 RepID=A0A3S9UYE1_9BACL|nr:hypothetical protein EI981_13315 [Paenibacillus lutimineralis]